MSMSETDLLPDNRFFIDHGMIHDRVTGRHVTTAPDDETWNGGTISDCLELLNRLSARPAMTVLLPPGDGTALSDDFMDGWVSGQQYLVLNYGTKAEFDEAVAARPVVSEKE